jgi:hypothetical protein
MTKIEEQIKAKIAAVEPFSKEEMEAAKKDLPRDADVLMAIHKRIVTEFSFLVEAAIVEGLVGNIEQSVLYHKLSFQCLQINGILMEHARGEGPSEYYLTARGGK